MTFKALSSFERSALALALLSFSALILADIFWLHPGFSIVDEIHAIRIAWSVAQGDFSNQSIGTGTLRHFLSGLFMRFQPPQLALPQLATLLVFLTECWLLWLLVRRFFGESAAAGALLFNLLCAFSLVRARSILSYSLMPCELLIAVHLILQRHAWQRFLGGLFSGLCLLDYEAWMAGGWVLVLMMIFGPGRRENLRWQAATLGLATFMGLALSFSLPNLSSYLNLRYAVSIQGIGSSSFQDPWAQSLLGLFWGGETLPAMGAQLHPTLPPWSWALLALGFRNSWKDGRWVLAWAGIGCLLLLPRSSGLNESNRSVLAWPAFCILAGLGWSELRLHLSSARKSVIAVLGLGLCLAGAWEARAFLASQNHHDARHFAHSRSVRDACLWIESESRHEPIHLLTSLGAWRMGEFEWLSSRARLDSKANRVLAVIPHECLMALPDGPGSAPVRVFRDPQGGRPSYLYEPNFIWTKRLVNADLLLASVWDALPRFDPQTEITQLEKLLIHPDYADAWVQSSLWWRLMFTASLHEKVDQDMMDRLKKAALLHAGPLNSPLPYLQKSNVPFAAELLSRAMRLDPRSNFPLEMTPNGRISLP